jgi:hypothetical protein
MTFIRMDEPGGKAKISGGFHLVDKVSFGMILWFYREAF